jgi:hypothetical protein
VTEQPRFAHASEAELARILDYYGVRWEYEPRTFPILWNLDGMVVESFSPDFYLPDVDLYVELTTLKQSLVRRKNRKLRRIRELYPDVRIKLFYGKDFKALMLKYGRLELAASLSGLEGQSPAVERLPVPLGVGDAMLLPLATAADESELAVTGAADAGVADVAPVTSAEAVRRGRPSRGSRRRRGRRMYGAARSAS